MESSEDIKQLLREIRDAQRESLEEYRKMAQRSVELQERAVARQEQIGRLYGRVVLVAALVLVPILLYLLFWLGRYA